MMTRIWRDHCWMCVGFSGTVSVGLALAMWAPAWLIAWLWSVAG